MCTGMLMLKLSAQLLSSDAPKNSVVSRAYTRHGITRGDRRQVRKLNCLRAESEGDSETREQQRRAGGETGERDVIGTVRGSSSTSRHGRACPVAAAQNVDTYWMNPSAAMKENCAKVMR